MGQRADEIDDNLRDAVSRADQDVVTIRETEVTYTPGSGDETAEIRADIENTRAEMSETIEALQDRLSPTHLKEQAQEQFHDIKEQVKEQVREQFHEAKEMVREATIGRVENMARNVSDTAYEVRSSMMDTIRQNPIPAALVGIGLGWMYMNRGSTPTRYSGRGGVRGSQTYYEGQRYGGRPTYYDNEGRYADTRMYDNRGSYSSGGGVVSNAANSVSNTASNVVGSVSNTASNVAGTVSDTASNVASTVSDTASNVASSVSETASNLADQAQYQAQRVEDRFQVALRENPLAVGAVALALGAAVGLTIPQTERENQLMGETRDTLVDRAQEVASETFEKVQRVATEVADDAKQTVKEQSREQGLTS